MGLMFYYNVKRFAPMDFRLSRKQSPYTALFSLSAFNCFVNFPRKITRMLCRLKEISIRWLSSKRFLNQDKKEAQNRYRHSKGASFTLISEKGES